MSSHESRSTGALEHAWAALAEGHAAALDKALATLDVKSSAATRRPDREQARVGRDALDRARPRIEAAFLRLLKLQAIGAGAPNPVRATRPLDWDALSLVDDSQVERDIAVARLGQQLAAAADWEFREVASHLGSVLGHDHLDEDRMPVRANVIARALHDALVEELPDLATHEIVLDEVATAMLAVLPVVLGAILAELKARGARKLGLQIRSTDWSGIGAYRADAGDASRLHRGGGAVAAGSKAGTAASPDDSSCMRGRAVPAIAMGPDVAGRERTPGPGGPGSGSDEGVGHPPAAQAPMRPQLNALLRRLTTMLEKVHARGPRASSGTEVASTQAPAKRTPAPEGRHGGTTRGSDRPKAESAGGHADTLPHPPPNLIRLHHDELQRAATGALDHLVIEVVSSLFDHVLADGRVPPQIARQIARLQLPVLRVTLQDPGFFTSRRHPVRQFVNRLASLACAFEDLSDGPGRIFLQRVIDLVQEIIDGDFEQVELYARQLHALERFVEEASAQSLEAMSRAPSLLAKKEDQLRLQLRYRAQLQGALAPLRLPVFLHDFLTQVWSQALVAATRDAGKDPGRLERCRGVARDLVSSVQPKGEPSQRKRFLLALPGLMRELQSGLHGIGWPLEAQEEFFAQLKAAHATALQERPLRELDHNLLVAQVESIFAAPLPSNPDQQVLGKTPAEEDDLTAGAAVFGDSEAQRIGWVPDQALPIAGPLRTPPPPAAEGQPVQDTLRLDLDFEAWGEAGPDAPVEVADADATEREPDPLLPMARAAGLGVDPSAAASTPPEPSCGRDLADHLHVGYAYDLLLKTRWKKVRLSHVSPGGTFYVFTHGHGHQENLTLSARMVRHVCAVGRMRTVEPDGLIERAGLESCHRIGEAAQSGPAVPIPTP